ncbi:MAG: M6 family metalloprotease domain-containing protein [Bacteroidaceae bacterium]|nr:M6 family metalloprotease domain-containing protein [Bacteroidaceae bacterium]
MKRILFFLLAFSFVLSVSAQDIVRTRNCRPKEPVHHVVQQAARRAPVVASNNPYIGDRRQLVVMVVFKDQAFSDDKTVTMSKWNKILNARNYNEGQYIGSFHDYFYEQSYGQLNINCDMYYMEVDSMKKYRSTAVDDENSKYLVQDVVNNIKSEVDDWSPYDWENDGYVNQLLIIYSGKGQNDGGDSNTIWPHQCWLSEHDDCSPITVSSGGKDFLVDSYCCTPELSTSSLRSTFGTLCHEFSHCFDLPDFYEGSTQYLSYWDLMDYGNQCGNGFRPCGYSAYERAFMGWLTPVELTSDTIIKGMPALSDRPTAYMIRNDGHPDEYYLIENRQNKGWDTELPGNGIVVFHVDYDKDIFLYGNVNTSKQQRYVIIPANDTIYTSKKYIKGWAYPHNGNNSIKACRNALQRQQGWHIVYVQAYNQHVCQGRFGMV